MLISTPPGAMVAAEPQAPAVIVPSVIKSLAKFGFQKAGAEGVVQLAKGMENPVIRDQLYSFSVDLLLGEKLSVDELLAAPSMHELGAPRPHPSRFRILTGPRCPQATGRGALWLLTIT